MENISWMMEMFKKELAETLLETNRYTEPYGLTLTAEDTKILAAERQNALKRERRIEPQESILPRIIFSFCDSPYLTQDTYLDSLIRLQEIFYLYKNEMQDEITDDELLSFMREQFDTVCFGDLDYLEGTCLEIFAQAVRAGYRGYESSGGTGDFARMDPVCRWDRELFLTVLHELLWE